MEAIQFGSLALSFELVLMGIRAKPGFQISPSVLLVCPLLLGNT